jgi:hypothetical protein
MICKTVENSTFLLLALISIGPTIAADVTFQVKTEYLMMFTQKWNRKNPFS